MIRNLKVLGLALAAVFAFAAVSASGAMAQQGKLTSDGPVTLTSVEESTTEPDFLKAFGIEVKCPGTTYTAHKYNVTPHEFIPSGATTFTLTPTYPKLNGEGKINCKAAGFPATVSTNGCDYVLHLGETTGVASTYGGTVDVVCPGEASVEVTAYTTEAEDPSTPFCTIKVGTQSGKSGGTAKDNGNGTISLGGTVEGIHASRTNHGAHGLLCPNATSTETASFRARDLVSGHNEEGEATPISLSHN